MGYKNQQQKQPSTQRNKRHENEKGLVGKEGLHRNKTGKREMGVCEKDPKTLYT